MSRPPNELRWLLKEVMDRHAIGTVRLHQLLCQQGLELSPRTVRRIATTDMPPLTLPLLTALRNIFKCSITQLIGIPRPDVEKTVAAEPAPLPQKQSERRLAPKQEAVPARPEPLPSPKPAAKGSKPAVTRTKSRQARKPIEKIAQPLFPMLPAGAPSIEGARVVQFPKRAWR